MKALLRKIRQILRDRRVRRFFTRVVSTLAAIVVFVTTYALVLPAITLERVAACGIEEHQHTDDCWSEVLICDIPESDGHEHNDDCYNDNAAGFQKVLKDAVSTYNIPAKLMVDNGSPYSNEQLSLICGSIGTALIHNRPRDGASKGKQERFWRSAGKAPGSGPIRGAGHT